MVIICSAPVTGGVICSFSGFGILSLIEAGAIHDKEIEPLSARHNLADRWLLFKKRFLDG